MVLDAFLCFESVAVGEVEIENEGWWRRREVTDHHSSTVT